MKGMRMTLKLYGLTLHSEPHLSHPPFRQRGIIARGSMTKSCVSNGPTSLHWTSNKGGVTSFANAQTCAKATLTSCSTNNALTQHL